MEVGEAGADDKDRVGARQVVRESGREVRQRPLLQPRKLIKPRDQGRARELRPIHLTDAAAMKA
jgi:hypothetical protein